MDSRWGPHSVDRFASHYNAQLRRFNSRFLSPGCCAVDGLSQDWHGEHNWLCPPVSIIVDVIRDARACRAVGTLIVPEWPPAFFWPLLKPRPSRFASFAVDIVRFPRRSDMIIPGPGQKVFFLSRQAFGFLWLPEIQHAGFTHRFQVSVAACQFLVCLFVFCFDRFYVYSLLVLSSIGLQLIHWPVCGMLLLRLPDGMACVICCSHACFERGYSCIPRVST